MQAALSRPSGPARPPPRTAGAPAAARRGFLERAEAEGASYVSGTLVDRLAPEGALPPVAPEPALHAQFPLACRVVKNLYAGWDFKVVAFKVGALLFPPLFPSRFFLSPLRPPFSAPHARLFCSILYPSRWELFSSLPVFPLSCPPALFRPACKTVLLCTIPVKEGALFFPPCFHLVLSARRSPPHTQD